MINWGRGWLKDRERYRLRYQYELMELLLERDRRNIRQGMRRRGLDNDVDSMCRYIIDKIGVLTK